jgi:hypothetical protein
MGIRQLNQGLIAGPTGLWNVKQALTNPKPLVKPIPTPPLVIAPGNFDPLPPGPDYTGDPQYVDRIKSCHYDVYSDQFWALHEDETTIPFNLTQILRDNGMTGLTMIVFWRDKITGKIFPNLLTSKRFVFDDTFVPKATAPNIVDCALQTSQAIPGAKALQSIGKELLEIPIVLPPKMTIGAVIARYESRVAIRYSPRIILELDETILKKQVIEKLARGGLERGVKVVKRALGPQVEVRGYITQEKYIKGCSLAEMEKRLGLPAGELTNGAHVSALDRTPNATEFQLRGYTNTPGGEPYSGGAYPPGDGVPQWQLTKQIPSTPLKLVEPGQVY